MHWSKSSPRARTRLFLTAGSLGVVLLAGCQPSWTLLKPGQRSPLAGVWSGPAAVAVEVVPHGPPQALDLGELTVRILTDGSFDLGDDFELNMLTLERSRPVRLFRPGQRVHAPGTTRFYIEVIQALYTPTSSQLTLLSHAEAVSELYVESVGLGRRSTRELIEREVTVSDRIRFYSADLNEDGTLNYRLIVAGPANYGASIITGVLKRSE